MYAGLAPLTGQRLWMHYLPASSICEVNLLVPEVPSCTPLHTQAHSLQSFVLVLLHSTWTCRW